MLCTSVVTGRPQESVEVRWTVCDRIKIIKLRLANIMNRLETSDDTDNYCSKAVRFGNKKRNLGHSVSSRNCQGAL